MGFRIDRYVSRNPVPLDRFFFLLALAISRLSRRGSRHCRAIGPVDTLGSPREPGRSVVVQAYILIQTEVGKAAQVAKEVRDIGGVAEAEDVTGPYDVIVRAEAKNVDELGKLVVAKIQSVEGITRTLTCPVVHL
jgi:DNA-binding Lrp family transcriptional regulator